MITDLRSSLTETKSSQKESSFPAGMPLTKLIWVANLQWPMIAGKFPGFPAGMPLIKLIWVANLQSLMIARKFLPLCHGDTRLGCVLTNAMKTKGDIVLMHVFNLTITKEILEHLFHTLGVSDFLLLKTG